MPIARSRAWLVAVTATLAMTVGYVDRQVIAAIGASVRRALDIDAAHFGLIAGAFSLAYLVLAPIAGVLVDRIGARRGLVAAMLGWSAVSAAHALAPSFGGLLGLRLLLGAAEAPSFPAAAQAVRRALPARDRSAAFGMLFTGSSLGAAIAAPLAIKLDLAFGWRAAFVIASALGLLWAPLWLLVTRPADVRAVLSPPSRDGPPRATAGAWSTLARDPAVLRALVLVVGSAPGLMFMFVWLPQYLELGRGIARAELPHLVWLPYVMADAGMVGFGVLAGMRDRRSAAPRSHVPLVLVAAAMEAVLGLAPYASGSWAALLVIGIATAGGGGLYTLLTADMMARVDPARVSAAGGLTAAAQSLVYVAFNPVVGRWIDASRSYDGAMLALGLLAPPAAVAWSLWPQRSAPGP